MPDLDDVKIEDVLKDLRGITQTLERNLRSITSTPINDLFTKIKKTTADIAKPSTLPKPPPSERYLQLWRQFKQGQINELSKPALKYLCWESDVLEDPDFLRYLTVNSDQLSARAICGLVSSIHNNWKTDSPNKDIARFAAKQLTEFTGKNRTISKWKTDVAMLLGPVGAAHFANKILLASLIEPKIAAEQWALSENTGYMRYAVVNAVNQSLDMIGRKSNVTNYVLNTLLHWNGWHINAEGFRFMVNRLILHPNVHAIEDSLRLNILNHNMLGDPRLPANSGKWSGIDREARQKFIGWLAKRDIVFFFDHVLKGKDRHGRRDFWLRYVDRMVSSRPLLSNDTAAQFRNNRDVNFGKLTSSTNQAAFILDFGDVMAVEFSEVGKIFIYKRSEFEERIKDIWANWYFTEKILKNQKLPDERKIRHRALEDIVNVDWRDNAAYVLAKYGVRP